VDGGIRRGSDVVKALALGAKAVLIGRPYVWAFGARGEAGVREILEVFRADIRQALLGLGVTSVADLTAEHVILPTKFGRYS
jgi:isopentenyl diphosphate isomerase/L-lactate dehydrogenase-like FMN-dependent dehydrogenase